MNEFFLKLGRIPARNYLVWLAVLAAVWIGCGVWTNGVASGDETRVAGISAEMVFRGDWLVPRLNGEPFLEYPPLFYWLQAIGFSLFGINDFAAAVPAALAAFGGVLTLFALGRRLGFSGIGAFLSCVLLLTCAQYLSNARSCRVDMLLAFAVLLAVYGFYAMLTERNGAKRFGFWCVGTAGLAAGILTKGLVGAALPAVALGGFLVLRDILERKFRWKNYLAMAAGGAVSLVPVGIWLWLLFRREGQGAFDTVVFTNNLGRFSGSQGDHLAPVYEYLLHLPEQFQPWLVLLFGGIWLLVRQLRHEKRETALFLLCFLLFPYLLLTASSSKRMVYLLPLCAPSALIAGEFALWAVARWRDCGWKGAAAFLKIVRWVPAGVAAAGLAGAFGGVPGFAAGTLTIGTAVAACNLLRKRRVSAAVLLVLIAAGFLTGTVESIVWHHRQEKESLRGLFEYCSGQARSTGAELVLYDPPERTSGAANYYLKRNVRVRKDAAGYDGKSPELWILRNKRIEGGMEFADSHRVYILPSEPPPVRK
ncbi:glycosyltransferase family 39 protein [uncultured Victivallis sp.]|uniref:ArnT family glycosyltransferase n=2 Tax=Victivallis TaxID=172900 RepID=UPI0025932E0D|nr:glycosyltransferase family 39 protein [uncultured Victivallis sp.]